MQVKRAIKHFFLSIHTQTCIKKGMKLLHSLHLKGGNRVLTRNVNLTQNYFVLSEDTF